MQMMAQAGFPMMANPLTGMYSGQYLQNGVIYPNQM
jgi:hypothetical protein